MKDAVKLTYWLGRRRRGTSEISEQRSPAPRREEFHFGLVEVCRNVIGGIVRRADGFQRRVRRVHRSVDNLFFLFGRRASRTFGVYVCGITQAFGRWRFLRLPKVVRRYLRATACKPR